MFRAPLRNRCFADSLLEGDGLEVDDLYSIIGTLSHPGVSFHPKGQISAGKDYFHSIHDRLTTTICHDWDMCTKISDPRWQDSVQLTSVIGDLISTIAVGVPPLTISSLIIKIGVRTFCNCPKK